MNYQLPNGKVIYISIDEYLSMTDADLQHFIASDAGETIINPFSGSAVDTKKKPSKEHEEENLTDFTSFTDDEEQFPTEQDIKNLKS